MMKTNRFFINNTLVVNTLKRKGGMLRNNKVYNLTVFRTQKGSVSIDYKISRDEKVKPLTMLDFLILDAAYLIYTDFEKYRSAFTVRQLIHVIMGTDQPSSKERVEKFTEEIEKLSQTKITINYKAEAEVKRVEEGYEAIIENMPLLPIEKVQNSKFKYRFTDKPPLYKYAEVNNQVISVPENFFYCKNIVRNTERNFLIKYALLHELEVMRFIRTDRSRYKNIYTKDSIIYFEKADRSSEPDDGLLTRLDWYLDEGDMDALKSESEIEDKLSTVAGLHTINDITATITKLLDYYVSIDYIKGYEILRRNQKGAVTGIKIKGMIRHPDSNGIRMEYQ